MDLHTPCLLLNQAVLVRNVSRMAQRVSDLGVHLRAHMKTSKSAPVMACLPAPVGTDATPIAVSTMREAEHLFEAGARDILHAIPMARSRLARARALAARGATLSVLADTAQAVRMLIDGWTPQADGAALGVLLEIDSDGYRGGLAPDSPALLECAQLLSGAPAVHLAGVYGYAGRTYAARNRAEGAHIVEQCRLATLAGARRLREAGCSLERVCLGGSPVACFAEQLEGIDELCAGVWMFNDLFQHGLGVCALEDIAVSVLATVVSANTATDTVFIDAGALALSQDRSTAGQPRDTGYGLLIDPRSGELFEGARVASVSQEHGHIRGDDIVARFPVGAQVRVLPNHACMTAACFDAYLVVNGDLTPRHRWPRVNGW